MATQTAPMSQDLTSRFESAVMQFRGLNTRDPGTWPFLPKAAAWALATLAVVALGWFALVSSAQDELETERAHEPTLKQDYRSKLSQAVNLAELKKQKLQVQEYVNQLERQLPGKAEMDALLSDINQAGIGRGLAFELFRPGQVEVKDYYAELPIAIRVAGRYHDIGDFAADVANLSRIVTLHNLGIAPVVGKDGPTGLMTMDATARTYRYLDTAEVEAQRKVMAERKAKEAKGAPKP